MESIINKNKLKQMKKEQRTTLKRVEKEAAAALTAKVENIAATKNVTVAAIMQPENAKVEKTVIEKVDEACKVIEKAIKAVKVEALSPRAICRAIRDCMDQNEEVATFAARLGITQNAIKADIDAAARKLILLAPYVIATKIPAADGNGFNTCYNFVTFQPTTNPEIFVARKSNDIFKLLRAAWNNDYENHFEVKAGAFYRFNADGKPVETDKVRITVETDKDAAKAKRLSRVLDENSFEDLQKAIFEKFGKELKK